MRQQLDPGYATVSPDTPVTAGEYTTVVYEYVAGHPVDDSGYLKIAFRYAGDFGTPQFDDPEAPDYCTVTTTGDCIVQARWDRKGNTRPWGQSLFLKITTGFLDRGQSVTLVFGDTSSGSPGWRVQTFCEETFEFRTLVDPIATYEFKQLADSPTLRIVPGEPVRAVCIAPSTVEAGRAFAYHLKLEDRWGNPTGRPARLEHPGFRETGIRRVTASCPETNLSARSNPIEVLDSPPALRRIWADFHGQSEETIGSNSIDDYFTFARDVALLDAAGHQGNDFQITDTFWEGINRTTAAYHAPGRFIPFPGYEWSGNTPLGGDRNVYFLSEGGIIGHSCADLLPGKTSAHPTCPTAADLFRHLASRPAPRPFVFAHVGGRYADLRMHDPATEWAVEIHSAWGTFEWLLEDALRLGYRVGVVANSDGHKGRPGSSYPGAKAFGSYGGLTCVLAPALERESIADALQARHCYATTGNRCLLDVELCDESGPLAMMGDIVQAGKREFRLRVRGEGTGDIQEVEVRNGMDTLHVHRPSTDQGLVSRVKILWEGAEVRGRARKTVWDGRLRIAGNRIDEVVAVNFWNADRQPRREGETGVCWQSITTGGSAGLILRLKHRNEGELTVETAQGTLRCNLHELNPEGRGLELGGLGKKLSVKALPDEGQLSPAFRFTLPLTDLRPGDNPVYVRIVQVDGHMAWSSPLYLVE